jgi:hypothetical protein
MAISCLKLSGLHGQVLSKPMGTSVAAGTNSNSGTVSCPTGYLAAGGGPKSGYWPFTIMWSAPDSATTWRGEVFNTGSSAINVDTQAICLKH